MSPYEVTVFPMSCYLHLAAVAEDFMYFVSIERRQMFVTASTQNVVLTRAWNFWSLIWQQVVPVIDVLFNDAVLKCLAPFVHFPLGSE